MNTFFLDLASHDGLLACVHDDDVVASEAVDHRVTDADLLPLFESVLQKARWTDKDLTRIACVTGPGGFTSLRVGAAFANTLAYALDVPAAGVHLSDVRLAQAEQGVTWVHSTKKTQLFVRHPGDAEPMLVDPEMFQQRKAGPWIGELIPEHRAVADAAKWWPAKAKDVQEILPTLLTSLSYGKDTVLPWYGRGW